MLTNIYVDGFNLYYGCLRGTPYRWLNLAQLCALILPNHQINQIRYFTALADTRYDDLQRHQRHLAYLRALRTIPNLTIHYGFFLRRNVVMRLANPAPVARKPWLSPKLRKKAPTLI